MHCTNCGTAIPDAARFCPSCGAATAVKTNEAAPIAADGRRDKASGNPLAKMNGCAFALLLVGGLWVAATLTGTGKDAAKPPIDSSAAAVRAKGCDDGLAALAKAGVLMRRPAADRMEVEDIAWAALPVHQKLTFAAALRCSALGGYDASNTTAIATVEGYRSGKLLVTAGPDGPIIN